MAEFHERFSELYENLRDKDSKFNKKDFARVCEISATTANHYMAGRTSPPLSVLLQIAKRLNTNISWLAGESDLHHDMVMSLYPYMKDLDMERSRIVKDFVIDVRNENNNARLELYASIAKLNEQQIESAKDFIGYITREKNKK